MYDEITNCIIIKNKSNTPILRLDFYLNCSTILIYDLINNKDYWLGINNMVYHPNKLMRSFYNTKNEFHPVLNKPTLKLREEQLKESYKRFLEYKQNN